MMESLRFPDRHPIWFVALLAITIVAVYLAAGTVATILKLSALALYGSAKVALALITAALLTRLGRWRAAGFRRPYLSRDLLLFWLPLVTVVVNLLWGFAAANVVLVAAFLAIALCVGFAEEAFFRGLMLCALAPGGAKRAALVTALVFGLIHSMNALAGSNLPYVLLQICYAVAIGFGYSALVLRTGTIWPLVVTHSLTDFVGFMVGGGILNTATPTTATVAIAIAYTVAFPAYGLFLLRGSTALTPALFQGERR